MSTPSSDNAAPLTTATTDNSKSTKSSRKSGKGKSKSPPESKSPAPATVTTTPKPAASMGDDYRSSIQPRSGFSRQTITTSSSTSAAGPGNRTLRVYTEMGGSSSQSAMSPAFGSNNAATAIRDSREKERKDLQDLNDRLANYIEKVRFLEAQNRKLAADLEALRGRWGKDTSSIRLMYEGELAEAQKLIDDTGKARKEIEGQIGKLQSDLADYRKKYEDALRGREGDKEKIDQLLSQLADAEAEVNLLRRRIENLEEEVNRMKKENVRLSSDLQRARTDLDQETLNRIDYQNQVQTLLEEIDFIRRVHDQEIKELQSLAARDTTAENREFFKNELAGAIRDIRAEYDNAAALNKNDMESWYKLKVQEIQTQSARQNMEQGYQKEETKRLRTQLTDLRGKLGDLESRNSLLEKQVQELSYQLEDEQRSYEAALNDRDAQIRKMREECQALMVELQMLLDTKQTLDAEIALYRKMLEGEENRTGLRQLVEQVVKTHSLTQQEDTGMSQGLLPRHHAPGGHEMELGRKAHWDMTYESGKDEVVTHHDGQTMKMVKGETATRTSFQRSAKGNISINETEAEGKFIILENTHRSKDEQIGEWKLKRKIDGKKEVVYTLPKDFVLKPTKHIKIYARGAGRHNPPEELVMDNEDSWGVGGNVQTLLYNREGEERATYIQRSSQQTTSKDK